MASVGAVYTGRMLTARAVGTISRDNVVILGLAGTIIMVLYPNCASKHEGASHRGGG